MGRLLNRTASCFQVDSAMGRMAMDPPSSTRQRFGGPVAFLARAGPFSARF